MFYDVGVGMKWVDYKVVLFVLLELGFGLGMCWFGYLIVVVWYLFDVVVCGWEIL